MEGDCAIPERPRKIPCTAQTSKGLPCPTFAYKDNLCYLHWNSIQPKEARQALSSKAGSCEKVFPIKLRTGDDIRRYLERMAGTLSDPNKLKAVAAIAAVALKVLERLDAERAAAKGGAQGAQAFGKMAG